MKARNSTQSGNALRGNTCATVGPVKKKAGRKRMRKGGKGDEKGTQLFSRGAALSERHAGQTAHGRPGQLQQSVRRRFTQSSSSTHRMPRRPSSKQTTPVSNIEGVMPVQDLGTLRGSAAGR